VHAHDTQAGARVDNLARGSEAATAGGTSSGRGYSPAADASRSATASPSADMRGPRSRSGTAAAGAGAGAGAACALDEAQCWSCGACVNTAHLFCGSCEYIQPMDEHINFFQLLEVYVARSTFSAWWSFLWCARQRLVERARGHVCACWVEMQCGSPPWTPFLPRCDPRPAANNHRRPRDSHVPFRPQRFDLDVAALERSFKRLQKTVHPDLFGTRSKREQEISASASSQINVAYKVLSNPAARAQYLLQLAGGDALGEAAGSKHVDQALLLHVLEARELLADAGTSRPRVLELRTATARAVAVTVKQLASAFRARDTAGAANLTAALQYHTKLQQEIEDWLAAHDHAGH
jgi:molecular chaperone HscB